jgi:hypothetical protein
VYLNKYLKCEDVAVKWSISFSFALQIMNIILYMYELNIYSFAITEKSYLKLYLYDIIL